MSWRFRRLVIAFQSTSTSTIPLNCPLTPLGIRTTVCHMLYSASVTSLNSACKMAATFFYFVASGVSSHVASINHWRRCSARIFNGPPKRFCQILHTAQEISSSSGMESSTRKGCTPMGVGCPGGGTFRYTSAHSAVMVGMAILAGGGGQSTSSLYHIHILIHASW